MHHFATSVARIFDDRGVPCGTGFLLRDGFVMTCAHVINTARGKPQMATECPEETERIKLDFPLAGFHAPLEAKVAAWHPPLLEEELPRRPRADIAVLELPAVPQGAGPVPRIARPTKDQWQTRFRSFGFTTTDPGGRDADGMLRSPKAEGWLEIQDTNQVGPFVEPGFSGAAAFDMATGEVLGMVVAASPAKEERRAFVLPSRLLLEAWPLLARPYRGLEAFTEESSEFFFGRERYVVDIADRLRSQAIVPIVGSSGSGKSSILLAGVIPRLKATGKWRVAVFRPGKDPVANLFEELVSLLDPQATMPLKRLKTKREALELVGEDVAGLVEAARAICHTDQAECLLLVVDQFEELFTEADPAAAKRFILRYLVSPSPGAPLRWAVTVRADFMGEVQNRVELEQAFRGKVDIWPMKDGELIEAIERPARMLDVELEPGLTALICSEVRGRPGALPLLQFLLDQLWQKQSARRLTHGAYQALGGLTGALAHHADEVLRGLCNEGLDETIIERTLVPHLVHLSEDGADTRRVAQVHELDPAQWRVLQRLADPRARLVVLGRDLEGNETAEVTHEALIRDWPKLRGWANEHRSFGLWLQRTRDAAREWKQGGEPPDLLLIGTKLEQCRERRDERGAEVARDALVSQFIRRSEEAARQAAAAREADLIWDRLELSDDLEEHDDEALWDLATSGSQTKAAFVASMLQAEARARRFNRHPDLCLQATLGLNRALKDATLRDVHRSLEDASASIQQRAAAMAVGIRLANSPSTLARCAWIGVELGPNLETSDSLQHFARSGAAKLDAAAARVLLDAILDAVRKTTHPYQLQALAQTAQGLTPKLDAAAARVLLDAILDAVRKTTHPDQLQALAQTAQGLTPKLDAAAARVLLDAILDAVRKTTDPDQLQALAQTAQGLPLDAAAARVLLDAILDAVRKTTHPYQLQALAQTAQGLPLDAAAARVLLDAILDAVRTDPYQLQALAQTAQGLPLDAAAARVLLDAILDAVRKTTDPGQLQALVQMATHSAGQPTQADRTQLLEAWQRCVAASSEPDEVVIASGAPLLNRYEDSALVAIVADMMAYPSMDEDKLGELIKILYHRFEELEHVPSEKWEIAAWIEGRFPDLDLESLPRRPPRGISVATSHQDTATAQATATT